MQNVYSYVAFSHERHMKSETCSRKLLKPLGPRRRIDVGHNHSLSEELRVNLCQVQLATLS